MAPTPPQTHEYPTQPRIRPPAQQSSAVALLIVAGISTLIGLFFTIPALVLGVIAVVYQRRSDPRAGPSPAGDGLPTSSALC